MVTECPHCRLKFKNENGMLIHLAKVHAARRHEVPDAGTLLSVIAHDHRQNLAVADRQCEQNQTMQSADSILNFDASFLSDELRNDCTMARSEGETKSGDQQGTLSNLNESGIPPEFVEMMNIDGDICQEINLDLPPPLEDFADDDISSLGSHDNDILEPFVFESQNVFVQNEENVRQKTSGGFDFTKDPPYSTHHTVASTPNQRGCLRLSKLLDFRKAPRVLRDDILEWARVAFHDGFDFTAVHKCRDAEYKEMNDDLKIPGPVIVEVYQESRTVAPGEEHRAKLILLDSKTRVQMLLNNKDLCQSKNLVFNNGKTLYNRYEPSDRVDEIQDGAVFQEAQDRLWKQTGDLVLGYILYIDKTNVDKLGRWNLEPVLLCLTMFNRETRAIYKSWVCIGYSADLDHQIVRFQAFRQHHCHRQRNLVP